MLVILNVGWISNNPTANFRIASGDGIPILCLKLPSFNVNTCQNYNKSQRKTDVYQLSEQWGMCTGFSYYWQPHSNKTLLCQRWNEYPDLNMVILPPNHIYIYRFFFLGHPYTGQPTEDTYKQWHFWLSVEQILTWLTPREKQWFKSLLIPESGSY